MPKIKYQSVKFRASSLDIIAKANVIIAEWVRSRSGTTRSRSLYATNDLV